MSLDQLFSRGPCSGTPLSAPVRKLYLCGAGTHPGGGVSGMPGHNAAREFLRDARRRGEPARSPSLSSTVAHSASADHFLGYDVLHDCRARAGASRRRRRRGRFRSTRAIRSVSSFRLAAPAIGRRMTRAAVASSFPPVPHGCHRCVALALVQDDHVLVGWACRCRDGGALYDPAFATTHDVAGAKYRRSVTALTLFGGFASNVFWPCRKCCSMRSVCERRSALRSAALAVCLPRLVVRAA